MLIVGSDTETTGLLAKDGTPGDARIIEVYAGLWDTDKRQQVDELFLRINPQRSIDVAAQRVHKIALADLTGCPIWKDVAEQVRDFHEQGDVVVGHNWDGFDKPFIDGELVRVGLPKLTKPTFDTMLEGRWATPMGTVPNLGALCFACDEPYDPALAHAADYDVHRMMACFFKALDWGFFTLPQPAATALAA
ncbi:3'-5' exonuclease [Bradyrhizobium sp. 179]|uniref:3'-5' exonuclease n=1 Tax=Bradyrhizobium sp. 179 TaxID=2782648 RepID=UPI001FF781E4|nr:3'-5' exonuclease [Bradyrhizobium sp. 179]MCK1543353.1 3'-5' exonuclease [Bradyrhizobium sp. 179]